MKRSVLTFFRSRLLILGKWKILSLRNVAFASSSLCLISWDRVVINRSSCAVLVSVSDAFKGVSQFEEHLFLISKLVAKTNVDLFRWLLVRVWIIFHHLGIVLFHPVVRLLVLDAHVPLLDYYDEYVHDDAALFITLVLT